MTAISKRLFSTDSPKAIKAAKHGFVNAIHYLAPADTSGVNLCSHASPGCIALCLGWYSGQAGMVADQENDANDARNARVTKARQFMTQRAEYVAALARQIDNLIHYTRGKRRKLCVRLNGSSDIAWEGIRFTIERNTSGKVIGATLNNRDGKNVFDHFPAIAFVDYTKNPKRFDRVLPANYHLVFSRSETNDASALQLLARGINVAAVFASKPARWNGFRCIDGDEHDLRQLDPRGKRGFVIALSPKGRKAKRDASGFVIR